MHQCLFCVTVVPRIYWSRPVWYKKQGTLNELQWPFCGKRKLVVIIMSSPLFSHWSFLRPYTSCYGRTCNLEIKVGKNRPGSLGLELETNRRASAFQCRCLSLFPCGFRSVFSLHKSWRWHVCTCKYILDRIHPMYSDSKDRGLIGRILIDKSHQGCSHDLDLPFRTSEFLPHNFFLVNWSQRSILLANETL